MRKHTTIDLDQELVRDAGAVLGTDRITDTIHAALDDVVRRQRRLTLLTLGSDLDLGALDGIRAHRFAETPAQYGEITPKPTASPARRTVSRRSTSRRST